MVLLALLDTRAMNGYDLMSELQRLFGPRYKPSAGSVYPALRGLLDEKLITAGRPGTRRPYRLTQTGKEALESRRGQLAAIENRTGVSLTPDGQLEPVLERLVARLLPLSGRVDVQAAERELDRAASAIEALEGCSEEGDSDGSA